MAEIIFSKGSGLNDSLFGKSQEPIKKVIKDYTEQFEKKSMLDKIFTMEKSTRFAEKYTSETSLGDFENVGENGAYPKTGFQEGYNKVIEPYTWKSSFEVTKEMLEDAVYGKIKKKAISFTQSYNRTREKLGAAMLAGGIGTNVTFGKSIYDTKTADGKALFSREHTSITGEMGDQSNIFTSAFSVDAMDKMEEAMQSFCDDNGNLLSIMPNTIIIPNSAALKRKVIAAIDSQYDPESDKNAVNFQVGLWRVLVWNYLPKTLGGKPYWIMADSDFNTSYDGLIWLDRVPLTVKSHVDENTDANVWGGRARFGVGFNNWRGIAICGEGLTGTAL